MKPAPTDEQAEKAWDEIMKVAREFCLVTSAYGGVAMLATPDQQRSAGIRAGVLKAHMRTEPNEEEK